eukprot:6492256-Amphidinium_carterae.2
MPIVWLGTLGALQVGKKKIYIPREAETDLLRTSFPTRSPSDTLPNAILGVVKISNGQSFHPMKVYDNATMIQKHFWSAIVDDPDLFFFEILESHALPEPASLMLCSDRKLRGFAVTPELGQAERLFDEVLDDDARAWVGSPPQVVLRLPSQHASLVLGGHSWTHICLPHVEKERSGRGGSATLTISWSLLGIDQPPSHNLVVHEPLKNLNRETALALANVVRSYAATQDQSDHELQQRLLRLATFAAEVSEQLDPLFFQKACRDLKARAAVHSLDDTPRKQLRYNVFWLIQILILSDSLRDSRKLKKIVGQALSMFVPPFLISMFRTTLTDPIMQMPHVGTVSRWRFLLDAAIMLLHRSDNEANKYYRWIMTDSSTQHGRTFQLTTELRLNEADTAVAMRANCFLLSICKDAFHILYLSFSPPSRKRCDIEDAWALREDDRLITVLSGVLVHHMLPPVTLGAGQTKLADKFQAVMHTLFLENGTTPNTLRKSCHEIASLTTDFGTEFLLPTVAPMPLREILSWTVATVPTAELLASEFHAEGSEMSLECFRDNMDATDDVSMSFSSCLGLPGMLHVIHNAASDVLKVTPFIDSQVHCLSLVCDLLSRSASRTRLCEKCFSTPVLKQLHSRLLKFNHRVYRERWGTVSFAVDALLKIKPVLVHGWNLEQYACGLTSIGTDLSQVDEAICSDYFWSSMQVLNRMYDLVRQSFHWAEGCPCHSHLLVEQADKSAARRWETCPMRGLRLPELAAGEFFNLFHDVANAGAVSLLTELPHTLDESHRADLLKEYEAGRAHLLYTFTLKFGAYTCPPLLLGACAHHSHQVARQALRECMASSVEHPLLAMLQSEPVRSEAIRFVDGADLQELNHLYSFLARFRFAQVVERRVEGAHARVLRRGRISSLRSEAYDSLALRMNELESRLDNDVNCLTMLSGFVDEGRSPKKMLLRLGFGNHPSVLANDGASAWSNLWRKIVYRSDELTLYHTVAPTLSFRGDSTGEIIDQDNEKNCW